MPQRYGIFFNESKDQNPVHYKTVLKKTHRKPLCYKGWVGEKGKRPSKSGAIPLSEVEEE